MNMEVIMTVQEAVNTRRSTRYYQLDKKISSEDMKSITDAGRKAPNGLGIEAWKFVVLSGDFSKIADATYNQQHIQDASHVVALVNYKHEYITENPNVITDLLQLKGMPQEQITGYMSMLQTKGTSYYREQTFFAASQMVLQATGLGIGSVVVGGFDQQKMASVIGLDQDKFEVSLVVDFGYPISTDVQPRTIRAEEEVVSYIEL